MCVFVRQVITLASEEFIAGPHTLRDMVSRSLEKMVLLAVGLMTAASVAVPVLLYSIEYFNAASQLEEASHFAEVLHNATASVDTGMAESVTLELLVPHGVSINVDGTALTVRYESGQDAPVLWTETYTHPLLLTDAPDSPGVYLLRVKLNNGTIAISFSR